MQTRRLGDRILCCILTCLVLLLCAPLLADGMPIKDRRFQGKVIILDLTETQKEELSEGYLIFTTAKQKEKLKQETAIAPSRFTVYDTRNGENECTCFAHNRALRFSENQVEIPVEYLVTDKLANLSDWEVFGEIWSLNILKQAIGSIGEMPYYPEWKSGDPVYWDIVRSGKPTIKFLIQIVDDSSDTSIDVPLFGGTYTVGDIAVHALLDIVHDLPVLELVNDLRKAQNVQACKNNGFGCYWNFVRDNNENRKQLQQAIKNWLRKNEKRLVWKEKEEHPAGGWWILEQTQGQRN